ncbi:type III secretion inner membrane ring lipoprotein SctJ [Pseudomonas entomophila]|nr:type III secretion inner membrane ring lipoprotein SctJ [Pseudomonas entomophila]
MRKAHWLVLLLLTAVLSGCKVELYQGLSEQEANEMLAVLSADGIATVKAADKDGKVKILVEEHAMSQAIDTLKRKGYPRERFSTLQDIFPKDSLISSPLEERARLTYAKAQELSQTLSKIDGVLVARVHVVLPQERDVMSGKSMPATAAVFIKHSADAQLDRYVPQIKQLVSNGIEGLDYDRISVALVPAAQVRGSTQARPFQTLLSIRVEPESYLRLLGLVGGLLVLLLVSNAGQFWYHRGRR